MNLRAVFVLLAVFVGASHAQTFYVRSGASGSGTGADWSNAFTDLPANLVRGATYYVAAGTYKGKTFTDPAAGTTPIIIKKATTKEHATSVGWLDAYGTGQATFTGGITFETPHYDFNGVTGGGPGQWTNNFGFRLKFSGSLGTPSTGVRFRKAGDFITVRHVHIEGGVTETQRGNWSYGIDSEGSITHTTISHVWLNRLSNKGYATYGGVCQYVYFDRFFPWDGGSGYESMHVNITRNWPLKGDVTIRYNYFTYYEPTGLITIAGDVYSNCADCRQWSAYVYGNIIDATQRGDVGGGGAIRSFNDRGWHNRFYGFNNSFMGNKFTFREPDSPTYQFHGPQGPIADARWFNNVYVEGKLGTVPGVASHNSYFDVTGTPSGEEASEQLKGIPWKDEVNSDFSLRSSTGKGLDLKSYNAIPLVHTGTPGDAHTFDKDMFGRVRGQDGVWDRGAVEFSVSQTDNIAPTFLDYDVREITAASAVVGWFTDEETRYILEYGTTTAYGKSLSSSNYELFNSCQISGLNPGTTYHVRITAVDRYGNESKLEAVTFSTTPPDTQPPQVSIVTPSPEQRVSATVGMTAEAADVDSGVREVRFLVDSQLIATDRFPDSSRYTFYWDSRSVSNGSHKLQVIAIDEAGNEAASGIITIWVENSMQDLTTGLVGYWRLDGSVNGQVVDSSPSGLNGTPSPGLTWGDGVLGDSASFVNSSDRIDLGALDVNGDEITLSAWVKPSSIGHDPRIISRASGIDSDDVFWILEIDDGAPHRLSFRINSGGNMIRLAGGLAELGKWTHVTGVYDGTSMRLYQNGVLVGTQSKVGNLRLGDALVWIGNNPPEALRPFAGNIDEVRIYSRALSSAEVNQLFGARVPLAPAGVAIHAD